MTSFFARWDRFRGTSFRDRFRIIGKGEKILFVIRDRAELLWPRASSGGARQREDIKRGAGPAEADIRVWCGIGRHASVWTQLAADDRHILPAVRAGVADWRTPEVAAGPERPDNFSGAGVKRAEYTFIGAALKKQVSCGGHHGRIIHDLPRHSPYGLSCYGIVGLELSGICCAGSEWIRVDR